MKKNNHKRTTRKTALVLAGGGLTGAAYEVGALRALEDLFQDFSINDFDIYIGTSSGAIVASLLANGMKSGELLATITGSNALPRPISAGALFHPNYSGWLRWGIRVPFRTLSTLAALVRHPREMTLFDLLWALGEGFPAGLFDNAPLERYLRTLLERLGYSNDFRQVSADLHIVATRLETGTRAAFSKYFMPQVPISQAVAASTAVPVLYKPVEVEGSEYVDGAARVNASLELALEQGAKLIICINPLVPFDHDTASSRVTAELVSQKGLTTVLNQLTRISTHVGIQYRLKQMRRQHPDVNILLVEPSHKDNTMFQLHVMNYAARARIAHHSYERVTVQLAGAYVRHEKMLAEHGIATRRALTARRVRAIQASSFDPAIVQNSFATALIPSAGYDSGPRGLVTGRYE